MTIALEPKYATCNDSRHTAFETPSRRLNNCYLADIKASKYTGLVNIVQLTNGNLRLAYETSDYSSCGQRLNGHCHLGKVNGVQQKVKCVGQWHFVRGDLKIMTPSTGTYRPCGEIGECDEATEHRDNMHQAALDLLGPGGMKGVEYRSSHEGQTYVTRY